MIVEFAAGAILGIPLAIAGSILAMYKLSNGHGSINDGSGFAAAAVMVLGVVIGGLPAFCFGNCAGVIIAGKWMKTTGKAWAAIVGEILGILLAAILVIAIIYITNYFQAIFRISIFDQFFSLILFAAVAIPLAGSVLLYELTAQDQPQPLKFKIKS
jgi:hypothetical protein